MPKSNAIPNPEPASTQVPFVNVNAASIASKAKKTAWKLPPKKIAIIAIAAVVVCILIVVLASGGGGNALVGVWDYNMNASGGPPLFLSDSIEFRSNGTIRYNQGSGFRDAGRWSVSGGKLNIDGGGGYNFSINYSVRGNTLTLIGDAFSIVYTKGR
jgi:hypothetical protein